MVSELTTELGGLSVSDKMDLIGLLWNSIPEDEVPISEFHLRVIEERLAARAANPGEGQSWEEVKAELELES